MLGRARRVLEEIQKHCIIRFCRSKTGFNRSGRQPCEWTYL